MEEVEQLSPPERTDLRRALDARVPMSEEDFSALAAESFRAPDEEEAAYDARHHAAQFILLP